MTHLSQTRTPLSQRLAELVLWPGDAACNLLQINDPDSRMLFRMFINTSIYGKIGVIIIFSIF